MRHALGTLSMIALFTLVACAPGGDVASVQSSQQQAIDDTLCPATWYETPVPAEFGSPYATLGDMLPTYYYDTETVVATFLLPVPALETLLPPGMTPIEFIPGMGGVTIAMAQNFSVSTLPPHNEWSLWIPVLDTSSLYEDYKGYLPLWSVLLVLNSEVAEWAGIVGWGLPKIYGNTHCKHVPPKGIKCMVENDGQLIMKLEVAIPTDVVSPTNVMLLSTKDGYLVRSPSAPEGETFGGTGGATLQLGDHPFARTLAALGVGQYPAVLTSYTPHGKSVLVRPFCQPL